MGPTPGSSIRCVGGVGPDSNTHIALDGLGNRREVSFKESKLAVCFIDYSVYLYLKL